MLAHMSATPWVAKCACGTEFTPLSARSVPITNSLGSSSLTVRIVQLLDGQCPKQSSRRWSQFFPQISQLATYPAPDGARTRQRKHQVQAAVAVDAPGSTPMGLEVTEISEPNSRVRLKVLVPSELCKNSYDQVIKELSRRTKVPGFRPGKNVPESVLVDYVGAQKVRASAVESILKRTLPEAMSSVAGRALKESEHILTKFEDLQASFSPASTLSYDVAVDVIPEVAWTSENAYKHLKVVVEVDEESAPQRVADAELRSRHKDLGSLRIVNGRGIEVIIPEEWKGGVAIVDISARRVNEDGSPGDKILSAEQKGFQIDTEEAGNLLPGLVEALIGLKVEESRSFDLTFPETWQQEALRGVTGRFNVQVKELFIRVLPELNDSLAEKLVENCTTLSQVKELLLKKHQKIAEDAKKQAVNMAITDELAKVTVVEIPNSLLEEQGRQMYASKLMELQASMKLGKEELVQFTAPTMINNYLLQKKETIKNAVKVSLAVAEIYKLENLSYTEEELKREVDIAIAEFEEYKQEYDKKRVREQAQEMLEGSKVLDWLLENVEVTYAVKKTDRAFQFSFKSNR